MARSDKLVPTDGAGRADALANCWKDSNQSTRYSQQVEVTAPVSGNDLSVCTQADIYHIE